MTALRERTLARVYATVTGATVTLIGIGGLLLGNDSLFGVLNIDRAEDAIHLLSGGTLLAAGLLARDERAVRRPSCRAGSGGRMLYVPELPQQISASGSSRSSTPGMPRSSRRGCSRTPWACARWQASW